MKMYKELSDKEYNILSEKFLKIRKLIRELNKISEEMANTLFLNTREHPEMKPYRIDILERKLKKQKIKGDEDEK